MGVRDAVYSVYERRLRAQLGGHADAPARRDHDRRQPALGPRRRFRRREPRPRGRAPGTSQTCSTGAARPASSTSPSGCCRRTTCAVRPRSSSRCCRSSPGVADELSARGQAVAGARGRRARPAAGGDRRGAEDGRGAHRRPHRAHGQRRGRVRRAARDRRRRALAAAGARRRGGTLEELAEVIDVDHIAEHLYTQGPARSRPRHPHVGRAAARRVPAVAVGALGVLLLRRAVAGLPQDRLPARAARLRHPAAPLRRDDASDAVRGPARRRRRTGSADASAPTSGRASTSAGTSTAAPGWAAYAAGTCPARCGSTSTPTCPRLPRRRTAGTRCPHPSAFAAALGRVGHRARARRSSPTTTPAAPSPRGCGGCCTSSANRSAVLDGGLAAWPRRTAAPTS